jgi:hypothetical protein
MQKESFVLALVRDEDIVRLPEGVRYRITPRKRQERLCLAVQEVEPYQTASSPPEAQQDFRKPSDSEAETRIQAELQEAHWLKVRAERPFSIISAAPGHALVCHVEPVGGSHDIYAADGTLLARTTRYRGRIFPWPRRVRWRLQLPGERLVYSATQGTLRAWTFFVVFLPVLAAIVLMSIVGAFLAEGDMWIPWEDPTRTKWHTGPFQWGLDYRGVSSTYYLNSEKLDYRIAYAQAVVHVWR